MNEADARAKAAEPKFCMIPAGVRPESPVFLAFSRIRGLIPDGLEFSSPPKVVPEWSSPEQVGVRIRSDELENVAFDSVNEQPVALDVALPAVLEDAFKLVVSVLGRQRLALGQGFDDGPESAGVLASLLGEFDVALELARP